MNYSNAEVRRQDRLLDEEAAKQLLTTGEYGVLSLQAEEGGAYGLPINYVWDGANALYLHCAPEGRKLRCLKLCDRVSFCVVGGTRVASEKFTTAYESIVLSGVARIGLSEEERKQALELFLGKYSPEHKESGMKYAMGSFHRTEIIRLDIAAWSGKCKRVR